MAYPVPTKAFLQPSSDMTLLFALFGCTHPPPSTPPFLLMKNLQKMLCIVTTETELEFHSANSYLCAISTSRVNVITKLELRQLVVISTGLD